MRKFIFLIIVMAFIQPVFAEKIATLPDLANPKIIIFEGDEIIISERIKIYIYSLKDFKLRKKFGRAGEGPKEFLLTPRSGVNSSIRIDVQGNQILVTSLGRISFFTKEGEFQKMIKISPSLLRFKFLGERFAVWDSKNEDNRRYWMVTIYDTNLRKIKELFKFENTAQTGKGLKLLKESFTFETYGNKVFIAGKKEFEIDVFDQNGKKLFSINQEYKKLKVTEDDIQKYLNWIKTEHRPIYEAFRNNIHFAKKYPAIRLFTVADERIYVLTCKKEEGKTECFMFDINGKLLKKIFLPLKYMNIRDFYPFTIKKGNIYQLVENEAKEEWELHVTEIK